MPNLPLQPNLPLFSSHWASQPKDGKSFSSPVLNTSLPEKLLLIHQNPNVITFSFIYSIHMWQLLRVPVGRRTGFRPSFLSSEGLLGEGEGGQGQRLEKTKKCFSGFIEEMKTVRLKTPGQGPDSKALLLYSLTFWPHPTVVGISVPRPGMEPTSPALQGDF